MKNNKHDAVLSMVLSYFPDAAIVARERLKYVPTRQLLLFLDLLDSVKNGTPLKAQETFPTITLKL